MHKRFRVLGGVLKILLDLLEVYIPIAAFLALFAVFVLQVLFRYVLNHPLVWPQEVTSMLFVWTTLLGAAYVLRKGEHVVFDLLYERLNPTAKRITELIGDALLIVTLGIVLKPSWEYVLVDCRSFVRTPALQIPYSVVYLPFVVSMPLYIIHFLRRFVVNLVRLTKRPA